MIKIPHQRKQNSRKLQKKHETPLNGTKIIPHEITPKIYQRNSYKKSNFKIKSKFVKTSKFVHDFKIKSKFVQDFKIKSKFHCQIFSTFKFHMKKFEIQTKIQWSEIQQNSRRYKSDVFVKETKIPLSKNHQN